MKSAISQTEIIDFQQQSPFRWTVEPARFFNATAAKVPVGLVFFQEIMPLPTSMLSPAYYVNRMGWSCQQEWKWEKKTGLPLRIRLGSQDQADWLDGKRKYDW